MTLELAVAIAGILIAVAGAILGAYIQADSAATGKRPSRTWLTIALAMFGVGILIVVVGFVVIPKTSLATPQPPPSISATMTFTPVPPVADNQEHATNTPVLLLAPTETQLPTPLPAPTETQPPTPVPPTSIPDPPGKGGTFQGHGLNVQLTDYEIRSQDNPEDAAVSYKLRFLNETSSSVEVVFSLAGITALDNVQKRYEDSFALAAKWFNNTGQYACISVSQPVYPIDQHFSVPGNSTHDLNLSLNAAGTEGDCQNWGAGRSRVVFETNYIDLSFATVKYRTDQLYELSDLKWRLKR